MFADFILEKHRKKFEVWIHYKWSHIFVGPSSFYFVFRIESKYRARFEMI